MQRFPALLLALALLLTAACIEPENPPLNGTTGSVPGTAPVTTGSPGDNPAQTPKPAPAEVAYLSGIECAVGDRTEYAYHCNGNVRVPGGASREVRVLARYPDNNTYRSGTLTMGGAEPVQKPFIVFPDPRYQNQNPAWFVMVDNATYPVIMSGNGGTAWAGLP